jgi:ABC-type transport system involved in cytochrome bd biosynthesis fused ATPase/permease subunit
MVSMSCSYGKVSNGIPLSRQVPETLSTPAASTTPHGPISYVMDNIRSGRPDATDDEVIEAAKAACCDESGRRLPEGYDTIVGDRIVVVVDGRLVEEGTASELRARNGVFEKLWRLQTEGLTTPEDLEFTADAGHGVHRRRA